jgi:hypothetical protein
MIASTAQFRANSGLVKSMREITEMEAFQIALEVLANESPLKRKEQGDANRVLGRVEGYDECLTKLRRLSTYTARPNIDNPDVVEIEQEKQYG